MHKSSRRATAIGFFAIAAALEVARYVVVAIWGSGVSSWSREGFVSLLRYIGPDLRTLALVAATAGALYLAWAELGPSKQATSPDQA